MKGYKIGPQTEEHKRKISEATKGLKKPGLIGNQHSKGLHNSLNTEFKKGDGIGDRNVNWKGEEVGYSAVHSWIRRHFEQPTECEECGTEQIQSYFGHWHNISGEYKRDRDDWKRLCAKCHRATF